MTSDLDDVAPVPSETPAWPDRQGQAALLLVESLIHGLIGKSVLTIAEAVEIIDVAAEADVAITAEGGVSRAHVKTSLASLTEIAGSLRRDLGE